MPRTASIPRRDFVRAAALAWPVLPPVFRNDPYRPLPSRAALARAGVRVRGRVHAGGRGIGGVGVSDGLAVVATDRDGRFDLVTDTGRKYVTVSVPAGYRLPTHPSGTARCFQRIRPDARGEMAASFALDPLPGGDDAHAFLVLADIQTQDAPDLARFLRESVPDVRATIAGLGDVPCFGVADGDIMWDELALYDDYERAVGGLGIPFVQVVGNHDLDLEEKSDGASTTTFERRFGPRYYSFDRGEVHYVVLDDVLYYGGGYLGYVDDDQLTWLANDLARVERGAPLIVFAHIPFWCSLFERRGEARPGLAQSVANRDALYRLLAPYRTRVLTGHIHESDQVTEGGVVERNHGTVCGAWWTGDVCYDGTPNGYGVYEVRGSEVRWRYQSTGRDPFHQLRVSPRGADPRAPDEIVANVWAWEPGWTVVWYEDGERRGEMSRRTGLDPRSVELHQGDDLPVKRTWVDPVPTRHLFYAPASRTARQVRVEARDLWGRSYSEVLTA